MPEEHSASELRFPAGRSPHGDALPLESPPPSGATGGAENRGAVLRGLASAPVTAARLPVSPGSEVGPVGSAPGLAAHGESAGRVRRGEGTRERGDDRLLSPALGPQALSSCQRYPGPRLAPRMCGGRGWALCTGLRTPDCSPAPRLGGVSFLWGPGHCPWC